MCDTPLEVRFMLAETEGRARALAASVRDEDAAISGAWDRLRQRFGGRKDRAPLGGLISAWFRDRKHGAAA